MAEGAKRGEVDLSLVSVDSTARAHGRSAGSDLVRDGWRRLRGRHRLRLKAALLGRSRGGPTSKVHLAADRKCARSRSS